MITLKGNYQQIHIKDALTLAIGNFDGVHLGHQNIIQKLYHIQIQNLQL